MRTDLKRALLPLLIAGLVAGRSVSAQEAAEAHGTGFDQNEASGEGAKPAVAPAGAPNIVLILIDDLGYSATDLMGGPIHTPAFDGLAAQGLKYNNFHTSAICAPTRAALLSGRNDHRAGFGTIPEFAKPYPGYNAVWKKSVTMFAEVLRRNGYSTSAYGKWHNTPIAEINPVGPFNHWPTSLGFDHYYGFMAANMDQWEPLLYRDTTPVEAWGTPAQGYHVTKDLADDAIRWMQTHRSVAPNKPYFLYFATGATHAPHQVPKEFIEPYKGKFDEGWDRIREKTFARQKQLGVIPADAELTPRPKEMPAWDSFPPDVQRLLARQMEVFAGFLAQTDHEIGRLIQAAQSGPGGDNTLIFYIAGDNGGSAEGGFEGGDPPYTVKESAAHMDDLGSELYMNQYASGWAYATSTPFQWEKEIAAHWGGTTDPLVIAWPAKIKEHGGLRGQFGHVNDIAATIYDVTGIPFPDVVDGVKQVPLDGTSLAYTFEHPDAPSRHKLQMFEHYGNRAVYSDGWVAAARHSLPWFTPRSDDFEHDRWELYHVAVDFSEAHDLAAQDPARLASLKQLFDREAKANDIYPLNNPTGWGGAKAAPKPEAKGAMVYYPGLQRLEAKRFNQPHRIAADVVIPPAGAEGVLLSNGSRFGGFVLYVQDGHLVYENVTPNRHRVTLVSKDSIPAGPVELAFELTQDDGRPQGGTGRLEINGKPEATEHLPRFGAIGFGCFTIGHGLVSPVSENLALPFAFTGGLRRVRVELK